MHGEIHHIAINAEDVEGARRFYTAVFGWRFSPWGPPDFYRFTAGVEGALQGRRDLVDGVPTIGYEVTIEVDDVAAAAATIVATGGTVLMEPTTIAGVGELIFFRDPAGNVAGAMRVDPSAS